MSNNPVYEQLIAQKLEQAAVPDMADAIWARIATQLDEDSTDDDNGNDTPSAPKTPGSLLLQTMSWIVVLALTIMLFNLNRKTIKNGPVQQPVIQPEQPSPLISPPGNNDHPPATIIQQQHQPGTASVPVIIDSVSTHSPGRVAIPVSIDKPDSIQNGMQGVRFPLITSKPGIDSLQGKRPKGVRGISDSDYRIVADTTRKNS